MRSSKTVALNAPLLFVLSLMENLCLYENPNEAWEIALLPEEVLLELPEPALGINFVRDGINHKDWLSLVAVHGDCWLLPVAFYSGARLNRNESQEAILS